MSTIFPKATIFDTEVRHITSTTNGQDYTISVWFPPGYANTDKTYPAVYLMDGDIDLALASCIALGLMWGQELPELIIVGIGYDMQSYEEFGNKRARDYTPTKSADEPNSGGAGDFLAFIHTDLIPFINANYRTDPTDRTISGYSHGGLFVLYSMLREPELFTRFCAGSPSLGWDEKILFRYEDELAQIRSSLPAKLYLSVGSLEGELVGLVEKFCARLKSRNYVGLDLTHAVLDNETHLSGEPASIVRGWKAIFSSQIE
jgi:uncharacterized protein